LLQDGPRSFCRSSAADAHARPGGRRFTRRRALAAAVPFSVPAFGAVLAIFWLMIARPEILLLTR
jgi:uncharacterized membrane protein